ncbi:unnamed protein product [Rangifer tarandus platyrhynchus]|uniref:Uncharacterized protein n=2 Tax=Rangifer tarandus platyrhynchus TaxID=3082113 RepID=A0ABN8ZTN9_RANTA|nr:unnamed protein product [Rangifer tarandus platyrhynchus]CAI9710198.1 unnamed protein product [Rangifer tarandus platyrhynchus]
MYPGACRPLIKCSGVKQVPGSRRLQRPSVPWRLWVLGQVRSSGDCEAFGIPAELPSETKYRRGRSGMVETELGPSEVLRLKDDAVRSKPTQLEAAEGCVVSSCVDMGMLCKKYWKLRFAVERKQAEWEDWASYPRSRPKPQRRNSSHPYQPEATGALPAAWLPPRPRKGFKRLSRAPQPHHVAQKDILIGHLDTAGWTGVRLPLPRHLPAPGINKQYNSNRGFGDAECGWQSQAGRELQEKLCLSAASLALRAADLENPGADPACSEQETAGRGPPPHPGGITDCLPGSAERRE